MTTICSDTLHITSTDDNNITHNLVTSHGNQMPLVMIEQQRVDIALTTCVTHSNINREGFMIDISFTGMQCYPVKYDIVLLLRVEESHFGQYYTHSMVLYNVKQETGYTLRSSLVFSAGPPN